MRPLALAHLSDLHFGHSPDMEARAASLADALREAAVDHVVVSGDLTHRGRRAEFAAFRRAFEGWIRRGRITVVPGNHDRLGDDVGVLCGGGPRVALEQADGLALLRIDSTGPHNRSLVRGHGMLTEDDLDACERLLGRVARGVLVVVVLHHHLLTLPEEHLAERVAAWLGRPWTTELALGARLLERLRGRADLVLHGHRHHPSEHLLFEDDARPLRVYNAGQTPRLGRYRLFQHRRGGLVARPRWIDAHLARPALVWEPIPAGALPVSGATL